MATYLLLLSGPADYDTDVAASEVADEVAAHERWVTAVAAAGGKVLAGEALQPPAAATWFRDGAVTDAPLPEAKEAVGGFYLVEAPSAEVAAQLARTCPSPLTELRPVLDVSAASMG